MNIKIYLAFLMSVTLAMNHPSQHELVMSGKNRQIPTSAYKYTKVAACNQNSNCFGCALSDGCDWNKEHSECLGTAKGNLMAVE